MTTSIYGYRRIIQIIINISTLILMLFLLLTISYYLFTAVFFFKYNISITIYDPIFQIFFLNFILKGYYPYLTIVLYGVIMNIFYSILIITWTTVLEDNKYNKYYFLILIYSFFNLSFIINLFFFNKKEIDKIVKTNINVNQRMNFHENIIIFITSIFVFAYFAILFSTADILAIKEEIFPFVTCIVIFSLFFILSFINTVFYQKATFFKICINWTTLLLCLKLIILLLFHLVGSILNSCIKNANSFLVN